MPSLPPSSVRVKRKATDDPVDVLRVQDEIGGVGHSRQYIFKRQRVSKLPLFEVANFPGYRNLKEAPKIIATKPGDEFRDDRSPETTRPVSLGVRLRAEDSSSSAISGPEAPREPRRFHLSRLSSQTSTGGITNRKRGGKASATIFVERKDFRVTQSLLDQAVPRGVTPTKKEDVQSSPAGTDATLGTAPRSSNKAEVRGDDSNKLGDEMQAYLMQEPAQSSFAHPIPLTTAPTSTFLRKSSPKYSPRVPALRYHERNPVPQTGVPNDDPDPDQLMKDAAEVEGDGSDYIIDTYLRVPAELYHSEGHVSEIGLLILDSQPDLDEFYGDDLDSDSETYDDEEDENAENHPSNDYPEDEEQSDDEYGRNRYLRSNDYASDDENFEDDEVNFSDEEIERPKYSQSSRPWMRSKGNQVHTGDEDEED